jgi:hypothetical protein
LNWIGTTCLTDGRIDDYAETWGVLFDAIGDARANGIPFDEGRTQPWKEGKRMNFEDYALTKEGWIRR